MMTGISSPDRRTFLVARIRAKQESREVVRALLIDLIKPTRLEPGCLEYSLFEENDTGDFLMWEAYTDQSALDSHVNSIYFLSFASLSEEHLQDKLSATFMTAVSS